MSWNRACASASPAFLSGCQRSANARYAFLIAPPDAPFASSSAAYRSTKGGGSSSVSSSATAREGGRPPRARPRDGRAIAARAEFDKQISIQS